MLATLSQSVFAVVYNTAHNITSRVIVKLFIHIAINSSEHSQFQLN